MSFQLTVKAPVRANSVGVDESWGGNRSSLNMVDQNDSSGSFRIASSDVIAEVRHRMARRGFVWE